jgi:hypothetical protein
VIENSGVVEFIASLIEQGLFEVISISRIDDVYSLFVNAEIDAFANPFTAYFEQFGDVMIDTSLSYLMR